MKKDAIAQKLEDIRISVAHVEEHLKTLNGTVARHERDICSTVEKTEKNTVNVAKFGAMAATAGGFGGLVMAIIIHFL